MKKYTDIPKEMITNTKINSEDFRVYSYILMQGNKSNSLKEISEKINIELEEVEKSINKLKNLGFIAAGKDII